MKNILLQILWPLNPFKKACKETRRYLRDNKLQGLFLLGVYQEQKKENRIRPTPINAGDKAREHVLECKSCERWLHKIIPKEVIMKQKHQSEYCCSRLYKTCEEYQPGTQERVLLTVNKRNEPVWKLASIPIVYCPWCGTKLPDKPY